jgi:Ca-activated chloride channel family protein
MGIFWLGACNHSEPSNSDALLAEFTNNVPTTEVTPPHLLLRLIYDEDIQPWIEQVTSQFNAAQFKISDGTVIQVETQALSSNAIIEEATFTKYQAHLLSPASSAYIRIGNAKSQQLVGSDMVGYTDNLLLTPQVIALWKPLAESLGWPKRAIGWAEILAWITNIPYSSSPSSQNELLTAPLLDANGEPSSHHSVKLSYEPRGHFKLTHPHPQHSNTGLLSLFNQIYAAADKLTGLSPNEVKQSKIANYLAIIQSTVTHYGESGRFCYEQLINNGSNHLFAALLEEYWVIKSYSQSLPMPLVAIYPKEGTVWNEYPIGIVERDWVTPAHREAAYIYMEYLLAKPQQEQALPFGFRPANVSVPLAKPIDLEHGVNPHEPKVTLEIPTLEVIDAMMKLWHQQKKLAYLTIVLDISGSMRESRIHHLRQSALRLLTTLADNDYISLLSFHQELTWMTENTPVELLRERLARQIRYQFAGGGTPLYDAIDQAYTTALQNPSLTNFIPIIVVFSDGEDNQSQISLDQLLTKIAFDSEQRPIRIFTIGYGTNVEELKAIAKVSQGQFYPATEIDIFLQHIDSFY